MPNIVIITVCFGLRGHYTRVRNEFMIVILFVCFLNTTILTFPCTLGQVPLVML